MELTKEERLELEGECESRPGELCSWRDAWLKNINGTMHRQFCVICNRVRKPGEHRREPENLETDES